VQTLDALVAAQAACAPSGTPLDVLLATENCREARAEVSTLLQVATLAERRLLELIRENPEWSDDQLAAALGCAASTVRAHRHNLKKKATILPGRRPT
jgi:DNA-binding CsgD family transcriptional regulator